MELTLLRTAGIKINRLHSKTNKLRSKLNRLFLHYKSMQTDRKNKIPLLFAIMFLSINTFSQSNADWELKRDKGGIKVYMREVPDSDIKELKFETEIEASLNAVAAILTNVEGFDDWVYASVISKTIKKVSDTEVFYYTEIDFPWPMSNRDLILHSKFWQDPHTLSIHSKTSSEHTLEPEIDGIVRITKTDIHWIFTPIGNGRVKIDYYLNSDPGGSIPVWMINLAADQGPLQTMIKFKEEIAKEKYRNAKLAFVQEFD